MKLILSLICLCAASTLPLTAKAFDLKDPAILGEYTLTNLDKNAEIQRAELIYNPDNKLIVRVDRGTGDYELSAPDKDGTIFDGTDEANCDGDEESCSYDASTVIKLLSTKDASGKLIPQLSMTITVSYAWGQDCGGTDANGDDQKPCEDEVTTYILNWNKALDYSLPYYTNYANPKLAKLDEACLADLHDVVFDTEGGSYLAAYEICGFPSSFKFRDTFEVAFPYLLKDWLGGNEKQPSEINAKEVAALFEQARVVARTYKAPGKVTSAMILSEIDRISATVLKSDRFFLVPPMDPSNDKREIFAVDSKNKIIVRWQFKIK